MSDRTRRLGENEVLYREVNERVRELQGELGTEAQTVEFVCECARLDCVKRISLTPAEYERVREDGRRFAILHGHDTPGIETVVERHERYAVVEKHPGDPAQVAEETDPRS